MIEKIKSNLKNQEHLLKQLLEELKCTKIHKANTGFRFGRDEESTGTANYIDIHTLNYNSYSRNKNGDIITLVGEVKGISTGDSIRWLARRLKLSYAAKQEEEEIVLPFGGFFRKYQTVKDLDHTVPEVQQESILDKYEQCVNLEWIQEGISIQTQEEFGVGYYHDPNGNNRFILPIRNEYGGLCGVVGRIHKTELDGSEAKYLSLVPTNRSKLLFGYYENYSLIKDKNIMFIVEAEKSVMKGRDLNMPCVALGKHKISPRQVQLIKSTYCKNIVIAFDEDVPMEECIEEAKKLMSDNPFMQSNIYIVNMNNPYIQPGSKVSLLDLNKETIQKILEQYLVKVERNYA